MNTPTNPVGQNKGRLREKMQKIFNWIYLNYRVVKKDLNSTYFSIYFKMLKNVLHSFNKLHLSLFIIICPNNSKRLKKILIIWNKYLFDNLEQHFLENWFCFLPPHENKVHQSLSPTNKQKFTIEDNAEKGNFFLFITNCFKTMKRCTMESLEHGLKRTSL